MKRIEFDAIVIGAGIFGCYAAKILSKEGSVAIIEINSSSFSRASSVNQTRIHSGCHYLRAPRTALNSQKHLIRFLAEHSSAVNRDFTHRYGIARDGSLTSSDGFERFCDWLQIPVRKILDDKIVDQARIESVYEIQEYSYDPFELKRKYQNELSELHVPFYFSTAIESVYIEKGRWIFSTVNNIGETIEFSCRKIINAAFSNINSVNIKFGLPVMAMKHEYSELVLIYAPGLLNMAYTLMDGPFLSITPYGKTGLHVLSSVIYTHHFGSSDPSKGFSCQDKNLRCTQSSFEICSSCFAKPLSNYQFMINQLSSFFLNIGPIFFHGTTETIKSTWAIDDYRDERETLIRKLSSAPDFYVVMSGKVSNIYELEGRIEK